MKKIFKWIMILFILILILIIWARYIGTYNFITKEYTIYDDISTDFDGLKVVHFSDIHYNRAINIDKIDDIVEEINLINPDIVVFTGDLIDKDVSLGENDYNKLINSLSKIKSKYGKYAITGEHDYKISEEKIISIFEASGFKYLNNDYDIIYSNNSQIFLGGINSNKKDISKVFSYFNESNNTADTYKIILVHEPDISDEIIKTDSDVDLILAGHSHNGQIRLPIIGAIYKKDGAKKYYDEYYKINNTNLYISSGIGVSDINYRLNNKPSINFYRINKK